jgi:hypothetical protein
MASSALASVIAPPPNLGDLARISRTVVFAEAQGSRSELHGKAPYTVTTFRVLQQVAGEPLGRAFEVQEAGGAVGNVGMAVAGAPAFEKGGRYLLFLDPASRGRWQTKMLAYGVLREQGGVLRPIPQAAELSLVPRPGVEPVGTYRKAELLQHLAAVASGAAPWHREAAEVATPEKAQAADQTSGAGMAGAALTSAPPACAYVTDQGGIPLRWFGFETSGSTFVWHTTPGQTGIADGGVSAVQNAAAAWTNDPNSVVKLNYAGSRGTTATCPDALEGTNEVVFNDLCNQIPDLTACSGSVPPGWGSPCCGQVAIYGTFYNPSAPTVAYDGVNWHPITGFSVVVNNGSQCLGETDFAEMMTHFEGHGLGFDHHNDSNATMYGQLGVHPSRGAAVAATDLACSAAAYHTFLDVPYLRWSWRFVEAIENAGIDTGCGSGNFCPTGQVTRASMAVFLVRGGHGSSFVPPPATGTVFADVPASHPQAAYIEQLYHDGLTSGCTTTNPPNYCPGDFVSRAQMATFLIRIGHGSSYTPPPATGTTFNDVPANYWAAPFIEQLFRDGGTAGCSTSPPMYCPETILSREEISTFLARAYNLPLP